MKIDFGIDLPFFLQKIWFSEASLVFDLLNRNLSLDKMSASLDSAFSNLVIEDIMKNVTDCEIDPEVLQTLETIWKKKFSEAFAKEATLENGTTDMCFDCHFASWSFNFS